MMLPLRSHAMLDGSLDQTLLWMPPQPRTAAWQAAALMTAAAACVLPMRMASLVQGLFVASKMTRRVVGRAVETQI
jgi:hypothetical protein